LFAAGPPRGRYQKVTTLLLFVPRRDIRTYRGVIVDNLSKAGWSWGCVSAVDCKRRTIWITDAHRDDRKRYVVHADEILTAFLELEAGD